MGIEDTIIMLKNNRDNEYRDYVELFLTWANGHKDDPHFADVAIHKLLKIKELDADRKNLEWAIKMAGINLEEYNNDYINP